MKKALSIIKTILIWLIVAFAVFMMIFTIISMTTFNRNDRDLFGYRAYIVNSNSMAKTDFDAGDLILIKEVDPTTLVEGDIITYVSQNTGTFGETITHKIRKITTDAEGNPGFITYGTTTDTNDETMVTYPYLLGKYEARIPKLGIFFNFLKTTPGYFVCIFVPFLLIILYEAVRFFSLLRKYRGEQNEQLQEENSRLLKELQALKKEMKVRRDILTGDRFAGENLPDKDDDFEWFE